MNEWMNGTMENDFHFISFLCRQRHRCSSVVHCNCLTHKMRMKMEIFSGRETVKRRKFSESFQETDNWKFKLLENYSNFLLLLFSFGFYLVVACSSYLFWNKFQVFNSVFTLFSLSNWIEKFFFEFLSPLSHFISQSHFTKTEETCQSTSSTLIWIFFCSNFFRYIDIRQAWKWKWNSIYSHVIQSNHSFVLFAGSGIDRRPSCKFNGSSTRMASLVERYRIFHRGNSLE